MDNKDTKDFLNKANALPLVDYLKTLRILPVGENAFYSYYVSPFIQYNFYYLKVDKQANEFYDSFLNTQGSIVDFGMAYYKCTLPEFLSIISNQFPNLESKTKIKPEFASFDSSELRVLEVQKNIIEPGLQMHLSQLRIPLATANQYCNQLDFSYYGERLKGIGFPRASEEYVILRPRAKLHTDPLSISAMNGPSGKVDVYQDFTDSLNIAKLRDSVLTEKKTAWSFFMTFPCSTKAGRSWNGTNRSISTCTIPRKTGSLQRMRSGWMMRNAGTSTGHTKAILASGLCISK